MSEIKAIQTEYKGYRMRSRIEARWAILFDAMGIEWEYEAQGFALPSGWYLPDFYFPKTKSYAEVKSREMTDAELQKVIELCWVTRSPVLALIGTPGFNQYEMYTAHGPSDKFGIKVNMSRLYRTADEEKYRKAVHASRSARFEHGEAPVLPVPPAVPMKKPVYEAAATLGMTDEEFARWAIDGISPKKPSTCAVDIRHVQQVWNRFLTDAGKISKQTEVLMSKAYPTNVEAGIITISFSERMHFERMSEPSNKLFVRNLLSQCLGVETVITTFLLDESVAPNPVRSKPGKALRRDPLAELLALDTIPQMADPPASDGFGGGSWAKK